ncbi:MAG: aminopeptidase P family protein [Polyangiaceae bacterium]|nr:aminopeptidase P family protein [Polyangiaceae bacterium]
MTSWPSPTPPEALAGRRARLRERLRGPVLLASGSARPRNFPAAKYPFRAESHFLYLVGRPLEAAALVLTAEGEVLHVDPPHPDEALWRGETPTLDELSRELGLAVRPLDDLTVPEGAATLPPQDPEAARWLTEVLDRFVEEGSGRELTGPDAALADAMIELRLRQDEGALAQLRQAAEVTAAAHLAGMRATRPGLREARIRAAMEAEIVAAGMSPAYASIVTVHGEILHAERHDGRVAPTDLVLADVGAETPEGWAGDVTRTWPACGRFSETQRALYEVVLGAQERAIAAVRPGAEWREVHRVAARAIVEGLVALGVLRGDRVELAERGAAGLFFPHGVGHLLGLDVHDLEDLGDRAGYAPGRTRSQAPGERYLRLDRTLEAGMCVTVEPGFYVIPRILDSAAELGELAHAVDRAALARFADVRGIRIEDDVLVTATGSEVLTASVPKAPADVEAAMRG